jgi:hypothetical protein
MKLLSLVIWSCWAGIAGRILLAPAVRLGLSEGLFLLLVCAPAVGLLACLRWAFRAPAAKEPAAPSPLPPTPPRPAQPNPVKPVHVQVF